MVDLCSPCPLSPTKAESSRDMRAVIKALPARRARAPSAAAARVPGIREDSDDCEDLYDIKVMYICKVMFVWY